MTLSPDDLPFETGPSLVSNAPRLVDAVKRKAALTPEQVAEYRHRGASGRRLGRISERMVQGILETSGFTVITQSGVGRRDAIVLYGVWGWSVEVKSTRRRYIPSMGRAAMKQAIRQCLPGMLPLVVYRKVYERGGPTGTRPSDWLAITAEGELPLVAWMAMVKGGEIPLAKADGS